MKRSEINRLVNSATACFVQHGWTLPPEPKWDVTDFGLGDWANYGLVLINLAEEPEYCEKLMYAEGNMVTPAHCHARKKEDIIARWGSLWVQLWAGKPSQSEGKRFTVQINGTPRVVTSGDKVTLHAGERITLVPGVYHEFGPATPKVIIGEVSTANDDLNDNFFVRDDIGRYPEVDEDEPPIVRLLSDKG